jgi:hypothetical protein
LRRLTVEEANHVAVALTKRCVGNTTAALRACGREPFSPSAEQCEPLLGAWRDYLLELEEGTGLEEIVDRLMPKPSPGGGDPNAGK